MEGIQKHSTEGTGFNSADVGYKFFEVKTYTTANADGKAEVEFDLTGITANTGIAKTEQQGYAAIIKYENYPRYRVTQAPAQFIPREEDVFLVEDVLL